MAEERAGSQGYPAWRPKPASWTKLFGNFLVAADPFKLGVAAVGILITALGWWLISLIFYNAWTEPKLSYYEEKAKTKFAEGPERDQWAKSEYNKALASWAMMHEMAGPNNEPNSLYANYYLERYPDPTARNPRQALGYGGRYRAMPWAENRGPNPYLMTRTVIRGTGPERRYAFDQFVTYQIPNLIEPLLKFLMPISDLFDYRAGFWTYLYLLLLILWLLVVWAFFGGVITRMAVMQLSGKEGGGLREAVAFVRKRYLSYLFSPLVPLGIVGFLLLCCVLFGLLHWIPILGDFIDGIFWFLPLFAGLLMTLLLIGMVGYPMMYTTLSAEGSDTFDALSRSYNYVYESPWHYLWYAIVAIAYGAMLTLFIVIVGSLTVFFAKWGVSKFPATSPDGSPEYLFIYAPESLGWQKLLTEGSKVAIDDYGNPTHLQYPQYMDDYRWYNHVGAIMVSFWTTIVFMLVIGFSYSYFWTASTQIYLLMRKRVDETEMDEVYVEEEAADAPPISETLTPSPAPTPTAPVSVPVEAPTLRQPETPTPPTTPPAEDKPIT
jgi:hypothetical protein